MLTLGSLFDGIGVFPLVAQRQQVPANAIALPFAEHIMAGIKEVLARPLEMRLKSRRISTFYENWRLSV